MGRLAVVRGAVLASIVFAVAAGCSAPTSEPAGTPTPTPTPTRQKHPLTSDEEACQPPFRSYNLVSPPYVGAGPHPIVTIENHEDDNLETRGAYLSEGWEPRIEGKPYTIDRDRVQLIVCVAGQRRPGSEPRRVSCDYMGGPVAFPIYEGSYQVTVREARSGAEISHFVIQATRSDRASCPFSLLYDSKTYLIRGIDAEALKRELRPLVEGTR